MGRFHIRLQLQSSRSTRLSHFLCFNCDRFYKTYFPCRAWNDYGNLPMLPFLCRRRFARSFAIFLFSLGFTKCRNFFTSRWIPARFTAVRKRLRTRSMGSPGFTLTSTTGYTHHLYEIPAHLLFLSHLNYPLCSVSCEPCDMVCSVSVPEIPSLYSSSALPR